MAKDLETRLDEALKVGDRQDKSSRSAVPREGEIVWNQGYEFTAHNVVVHTWPNGDQVLRYVGRCTSNVCNDSIRGTGYDGGVYGYKIS
jgi:hypothetical protein